MKLVLTLFFIVIAMSPVYADFNYSDFRTVDNLSLFQNASISGFKLRLTPSAKDQFGSAWRIEKQSVADGFETTFQFQIADRGSASKRTPPGGVGFAFVIQNNRITGLTGNFKGYYNLPNSLAVEFDTLCNKKDGDSNDNHISVQTRGENPNSTDHGCSLGLTTGIPDMSDGKIHQVKIEYRPGTMKIYFDGLKDPALTVPLNLSTILTLDHGKAWIGFTAATGPTFEKHDLLTWSFKKMSPLFPTTQSTQKAFRGKMILIQLGDPLEDQDQIKILRTNLKKYPARCGLLLWIDSLNGDPALVDQMNAELQKFTGPKVALVGGGRFKGVYGELAGILSSFDEVLKFPNAVISEKPPKLSAAECKVRSSTLPSSAIDPARLAYWTDAPVSSQQIFSEANVLNTAKTPREAIRKNGLELTAELTSPIVLKSKLGEKIKQADILLSNLSDNLRKSIAPRDFWNSLDRARRTNVLQNIQATLDDLIQNAHRGKIAIAKLTSLIESSPAISKFIKTEGLAAEAWREDPFVYTFSLKNPSDNPHRNKKNGPRQRVKNEPSPNSITPRNRNVRIELYYGPNLERLKDTSEWLDSAIFNYQKIKNDLVNR
ncbi:MAG: L-type lectin-domain containing protein [Phycisphaerae bacterium]